MILFDVLIKGVMLMAFAFVATAILRKKSAAMRHAIWSLIFSAMVFLPLFLVVLPILVVSVQPFTAPQTGKVTLESSKPTDTTSDKPLSNTSETHKTTVAVQMPEVSPFKFWANVAFWVWAMGFVLVLTTFFRQLWAIRALRKSAMIVEEKALWEQLHSLQSLLKLRTSVALLHSDRIVSPMTFGTWKPVILLPTSWISSTEAECKVALLHELAHIKRHDFLKHLLAQTAVALHWCNPLVWLGKRQMLAERERACDDVVLARGFAATWYAEQLISLARKLIIADTTTLKQGISMAHTSELKTRIEALLNANQNRNGLSRTMIAATFASIALLVLVIAPIRFQFAGQTQAMTLNEALNLFKDELSNQNTTLALFAPVQRRSENTTATPKTATDTTKTPTVRFLPPVMTAYSPNQEVLDSRLGVAKAKIELQQTQVQDLQKHQVFSMEVLNAVDRAKLNVHQAEIYAVGASLKQQLQKTKDAQVALKAEVERQKSSKPITRTSPIPSSAASTTQEELLLLKAKIAETQLALETARNKIAFNDPKYQGELDQHPNIKPIVSELNRLKTRVEQLVNEQEAAEANNINVEAELGIKLSQIEQKIQALDGELQSLNRNIIMLFEKVVTMMVYQAEKEKDIAKLQQILQTYHVGFASDIEARIRRLGGVVQTAVPTFRTGMIRGRIESEAGHPMGEMVNLDVQIAGTQNRANTNAFGEFTLTDAQIGEREIVVGGIGWEKKRVKIDVQENEISYIVIKLKKL